MGHKIDNSNSTIQKLNTLYCDPELSDLSLLVEDKTFHAHKLILSISSDVFKTMLTSPTWPEAYTSQIVLQEEPECIEVFGDFLRYLYTGHIHLSQSSVLPVLILADKYNIRDLSDVCIEFMCNHYVAPSHISHVVSWLKYAMMCEHKKLENVCEQYIKWNFQTVMEMPDFMNISPDMILNFLHCSEVVVHSEYELYKRIQSWIQTKVFNRELKLNSKKPALNLEKFIEEISQLINFDMMSCAELMSIMKDDLVKQFSLIFIPKITYAFRFHEKLDQDIFRCTNKDSTCCDTYVKQNFQSKQQTNTNEITDFGNVCLTRKRRMTDYQRNAKVKKFQEFKKCLRNYTCDAWSTEMVVNDITSVCPGDVHGAFFSTPVTGSEADETCWDWHIDLYAKGIIFKKCMMIGIYENFVIDEVTYDNVRLTVSSNNAESRHVRISILVYGEQQGIEYISNCVTRTCFFDNLHALQNFNDVIDFKLLDMHKGLRNADIKVKIVIQPLDSGR